MKFFKDNCGNYGIWLDIRKHKPKVGIRVLACDENGFVDFLETDDVHNRHVGKMTWLQSWKYGNGTKIVAWMPLPEFPERLCNEDADGEMP